MEGGTGGTYDADSVVVEGDLFLGHGGAGRGGFFWDGRGGEGWHFFFGVV